MKGDTSKNSRRLIGLWLFGVAFMVFVMVVLGGLTRLTGSGLSMVDWRPITGWLPPLNEAQWQAIFDLYKQSPQFKEFNFDMDLDGFRGIFWLEFLHRLWGRLIGLAFGLPLLIFLLKGWIEKSMRLPMVGLFLLGGAQGVLGWYMVKSGLVDDPEVSQYRLMAHLGFAFILYSMLVWAGLSYYKGRQVRGLNGAALGLWGLGFVTILAGALVAGLDAGLTYNTFPLMDGDLIPNGLYSHSPAYLNHFENITTVQFQHRVLAVVTFILCLVYFACNRESRAAKAVALLVCVQATLGILTLLHSVPTALASLHQAFGLLLFSALTWLIFETRR
ncbi:COX15/CtaA family protein [Terasakiella pusilla]|uniref:COX15/CtaA family protein n=1 Tax=Terasakiella pusilla TaxID=64973 RepID=UPI003AA85E70